MSDTKFKPGQSGNPTGRPKIPQEVKDLARAHTNDAIMTLVEICNDKKATAPARVSAANSILDRAWGKPTQPTEISGPDGEALPSITVSFVKPDAG